MNLQMTDLKRVDGYIPRRSSDGSTSSKATSNTTTDHLKGYHLPYHTSDIKESSPFLTPNEEDEEEGEGRAYGREGERMTLQKKTGSVRRFSPNLSFLLPSSKRKSLAIILILVIVIMVCNTITHPTPDYDLLPASKYHAILNQSISKSFPDHMKPRLALELNQKDLPSSRPGRRGEAQGLSSSQSLMPSTLFQTDKKASKLVEVERSWDQAGARRVFLDDKGAWDFIHRNYNSSEIWDVYEFLPIPVLKSDFLRYSALLAEGGIYSDMDTRVLMPIEQWWKGAQVFTPKTSGSSHSLDNRLDLNSSSSSPTETWHEAENPKRELQREAVRFLVGIENDSKLWHSVRNIAEALWLLPLNRHRPLQFVQWTLQSAPNHPILVDTLRRIVNTSHFAKALMIEREREANFYEAKGNIKKAEKVRKEAFPWNGLRGKEFERTGVEEWTGPGAFTDAVMSYLNAVAGLKKSDLQKLKQPLQVRDVVILPSSGFNPFESQLPNPMARVVHLFRGSWK